MTSKKDELFCTKYTKALGRAIVQKIEEGYCIKEICEKLKPKGFPNEKTIYRWKKKYPEFKQAIDEAYQDLIFKMMDETTVLTKELMEMTEKLKECSKAEQTAIHLHQVSVKARIQNLQFTLSRIAPKLVLDLKDQSVATAPPQITIVNYSRPQQNPPKLIDNNDI